jgi:gliding motility-associated-like protein
MEKNLLSFSNYFHDIQKIRFVVLLLISSSLGFAQTITPTGSVSGNQTVSTSAFNHQNPFYFVPCIPFITGVLIACESTTLTAVTNAASPTYVWYKNNTEIIGQTASTLTVTASGAYKVKVKDGSTNFELTSAPSLVAIIPAFDLVLQQNITIAGCSTPFIIGLLYSTADISITLAQLNTAGCSITNSANLGSYTISYSDTATGICPMVITRTFKLTTPCGTITKTQTITFQDTAAPIWITTANALNRTLQCNDPAGLITAQNQAPFAIDNCGGTVTYTKTSGNFTAGFCANSGTYTNKWVAKDFCLNTSAIFTQVITITDTPPIWTTTANALNRTLQCNDSAGLTSAQALFPTAIDLCDANVLNIVKNSGPFVASGSCSNTGTYTNTWTVTDDCGNISNTFSQVITIQDSAKPTWTTQINFLNRTLECSDSAGLTSAQALFPMASDLCDANVLNIVKNSGPFVASGSCSNAGTYTNTWTVSDDCGNISNTFTQIITIQDSTKPTWTTQINVLNRTLECNDSAGLLSAQALFPTAIDLCDANVLNIVKNSGPFVASGSCSNTGTYTNTWAVSDDCGNISNTFTQIITIQDSTKPTWTTQINALNRTLECSDSAGLTSAQALFPTASDLCDANVLNIVKNSGPFVASGSCSNAGTYTNTWTVSDDCGNISNTFSQVITIQDSTKPIFSGNLPTDITVSCDAVPEPADMNVVDNCNINLPIVFSEVKSNIQNGCTANYTLTRKWTTSDCSGNTASFTQIITLRDTTPPTGTAPANVADLQNIADIPLANPQDIKDAADNCSQNINITISDSNNGASGCEGNAYILTRTYTLTDCAGNKTDLVQTFTVENKVSVSGVASHVTCYGGNDGLIMVTNSPGSTVVIRNEKNEVVSNANLPAGTYTLTASSSGNNGAQTCTEMATVIITQPTYSVKISGQIINIDTNTPIANVPVTLIPQGSTTGPILLRITGNDGLYNFSGIPTGTYLVQVQDANLNSVYQLYPVNSSLFFTTLEDCIIQEHNFEYGKSTLPVLGDYVWYDTNSNGVQDEWYDANNDGIVTKNIPDSGGTINYSQWEWIDLNGDGSYTGPLNTGELNAGGFGNALTPNVIIDGPNGYHAEVIIGIEGFWRNRPETQNPYGDYTIKLVRDANLDGIASALGATNLVKVLPSVTAKKITSKTGKSQLHTVCQTTTNTAFIVTVTAQDLVHLDADFGVSCKVYSDIVANDDNAGPITGVNHTITNVLNVLSNDTLEGVVVTASDVIISTVTPNEFLQLNPDGSVNILPNAPVGTLTLVYQICEGDQTANCDTATVTITITGTTFAIVANDDNYGTISCNTFGLVGNVLNNDVLNLAPATIQSVNFTVVADNNNTAKTDPNITIDAIGNVRVSSLTPAGSYTYRYQICEKLNPANCDTATITITVLPNGVTNIMSQACADDSSLVDLFALLPENTSGTGNWIDTNNSNALQGNILNPFGLALGNYLFEYKITDENCPRSIVVNVEINDDCKVLACGNVVIHNAFSPNGDGLNDVFKIDSIDDLTCYPENSVEIYNRWGILVFDTVNYNNTTNVFDGNSKGRTTIKQSDGLPTGTYFYIVNYKSLDGNNVIQSNKKDGYLYLSK